VVHILTLNLVVRLLACL